MQRRRSYPIRETWCVRGWTRIKNTSCSRWKVGRWTRNNPSAVSARISKNKRITALLPCCHRPITIPSLISAPLMLSTRSLHVVMRCIALATRKSCVKIRSTPSALSVKPPWTWSSLPLLPKTASMPWLASGRNSINWTEITNRRPTNRKRQLFSSSL